MKQQLAFILKLRGISALLVMFYHHCHFFWVNQDFCGQLAQHLPVTAMPWIAGFLESLPINLGNVGVAIFFLISGFLMPIAAQNKTCLEFLLRRIWRIWPAYVIALLLTMFLVYVNSRHNQHQQIFPLSLPWSVGHITASLFLVRDIGGYPFIDGIVWTLEIEMKFYFLCFVARTWLVEKPIKFILLVVVLAVLSFVLMGYRDLIGANFIGNTEGIESIKRLIQIFFKTMKYICFIGLGCLLSYVYQKKIAIRKALVYSLILVTLYFGHFIHAENYTAQWREIVSYSLADLLFIVSYVLKGKFLNRGIMASVGDMSYSLYLVHGVPGFVVMYWMMNKGIEPLFTILATVLCLLLTTKMFYWTVENNFIEKL